MTCSRPSDWVRFAVAGALSMVVLAPVSVLANVYRCEVKSVQQLTDSGMLSENEWARRLARHHRSIVWDDITGLLRGGPAGVPATFDFIQRGTRDNSTIAIFVNRGSASTYVSVFRLETYGAALPFMLTENATVYSGNCERLG